MLLEIVSEPMNWPKAFALAAMMVVAGIVCIAIIRRSSDE